jgi:hypothetical protein
MRPPQKMEIGRQRLGLKSLPYHMAQIHQYHFIHTTVAILLQKWLQTYKQPCTGITWCEASFEFLFPQRSYLPESAFSQFCRQCTLLNILCGTKDSEQTMPYLPHCSHSHLVISPCYYSFSYPLIPADLLWVHLFPILSLLDHTCLGRGPLLPLHCTQVQ